MHGEKLKLGSGERGKSYLIILMLSCMGHGRVARTGGEHNRRLVAEK